MEYKDLYLSGETCHFHHDLRSRVQHNGCYFRIWDMVEVSLGIKHGYIFYALRLRGLQNLPLNKEVKFRFDFDVRGPVIALALVSPCIRVPPVSLNTVTYDMTVTNPIKFGSDDSE